MSVVLFRFSISNYKCCLDFGILAFTFVNEIVLYKSNMFIFPMMRLPIECKLIITNCHGEWWATEEKKHKIMRTIRKCPLFEFVFSKLTFFFFLSFFYFLLILCLQQKNHTRILSQCMIVSAVDTKLVIKISQAHNFASYLLVRFLIL